MPEIKLGKLPDRTPVKLTITITPDLKAALDAYALSYKETYGTEEPLAQLVAAMLEQFIASDRNFMRSRAASK